MTRRNQSRNLYPRFTVVALHLVALPLVGFAAGTLHAKGGAAKGGAAAETAWVDELAGPEITFFIRQPQASVKLMEQGFDTSRAQYGGKAQRMVLACAAGHAVMIAHQLPRAPAIAELRLSASVMSSHPGVRLAARVVLPRSTNPETGAPIAITVRGPRMSKTGSWQSLHLDHFPEQIDRQTRVARAQYRQSIDPRGAYLDQLLLIVPGGPDPIELLIDRIEIDGIILRPPRPVEPAKPSSSYQASPIQLVAGQIPKVPAMGSGIRKVPETGEPSTRQRPKIPRVIQWNGEPLENLAGLGFDAIAMQRTATADQLKKAAGLGLYLVCPPMSTEPTGSLPDQTYANVLTWDLGSLAIPTDLADARWRQRQLQRSDTTCYQPSILAPGRFPCEASRIADLLLLGRYHLGTCRPLRDEATWLMQQQRLARPGVGIWSRIETDMEPGASAQMILHHPKSPMAHGATSRQLADQIALAAMIGARGFYFASYGSLSLEDLGTRRRALAIAIANLRIGLMAPWLASGKLGNSARSSDPNLTAVVLRVERSHLMIPIDWSVDDWSNEKRSHPFASAGTSRAPKDQRHPLREMISFVVPSIGESCEAHLLSPVGTKRLRHRRVAGGVSILLDRPDPESLVLLTENSYALSRVSAYLRKHGMTAARWTRDLAAIRLQQAVHSGRHATSESLPRQLLDRASHHIGQSDRQLARKNVHLAFQHATRAGTLLDKLEGTLVRQSSNAGEEDAGEEQRPSMTALASVKVASARGGPSGQSHADLQASRPLPISLQPNKLAESGFEDLDRLLRADWRHHRLPIDGVTTAVRLSPVAPHSGIYCLEMEVLSESMIADGIPMADGRNPVPGGATAMVSTAPVWVQSAPVFVRAGQQVEISGMIRIPTPLTGSVDGLFIFDSLGGKSMALSFGQIPSWKQFRMVRTAIADSEVRVTFAMTGLGTAQIDDVAVRVSGERRAESREQRPGFRVR